MPKQHHWAAAALIFFGFSVLAPTQAGEAATAQTANVASNAVSNSADNNKAIGQNNVITKTPSAAAQPLNGSSSAAKPMAEAQKADVAKVAEPAPAAKTETTVKAAQQPATATSAPAAASASKVVETAKLAETKKATPAGNVKPQVEAAHKAVEPSKPAATPGAVKETEKKSGEVNKPEVGAAAGAKSGAAKASAAPTLAPEVVSVESSTVVEQKPISIIEALISLVLGAVFLLVLFRGNLFAHHE